QFPGRMDHGLDRGKCDDALTGAPATVCIAAMERPISSHALAQVQDAVFNGEKIRAIKIYREDTGVSLSDAKQAIERLEAEWRASSPEKFKTPPAKRKGCGICLMIFILIALGAILAFFLARPR